MKVTYNAPPGDDEIIQAYGRVFESGKAVDIGEPDERLRMKIAGNPHFEIGGQKREKEPQADDSDRRLTEATQRRTEDARKARDEAARAEAEAAAKERAVVQAEAVGQVRAGGVAGDVAAGGTGVVDAETLPTPPGGGSPDHGKRSR
jgi:hypothetical protein